MMMITSTKAVQEVINNIPFSIDRKHLSSLGSGKIAPGAFSHEKSTNSWREIRKALVKTTGINFVSKLHNKMLHSFESISISWPENQFINFSNEAPRIMFEIISSILYGDGVNEKIGNLSYKTPEGPYEEMNFGEFFSKLARDSISLD
jgi:hypothetical protein